MIKAEKNILDQKNYRNSKHYNSEKQFFENHENVYFYCSDGNYHVQFGKDFDCKSSEIEKTSCHRNGLLEARCQSNQY